MSDSETDDANALSAGRDLKVKSTYASGAVLVGSDGTVSAQIADAIAVTGTLLSPPNSRDVQIEKFSLQAYGRQLVKDSDLTFINGRRYGLIAPNGSGKSTIMHAIACGLVPTPMALDYYLLDREFIATEMTSLEAVLNINEMERECLTDEMEHLLDDPQKNEERLEAIQTRLADLEVSGEDRIALEILRGLGFSETLINTKTKDLSGGWRMRISLARVLFVKPTLMLLDEPTNHLDLEAVVWLEEYLVHNLAGHTLVMTCHSQDTLNEVCTDIIHLYHQKLDYYKGDYNTFTRVRADKTALLTKQAIKDEKKMAAVAQNLTKTGTAAQAQAKAKLKNMEKEKEKKKESNKDLQEELIVDKELSIRFGQCGGGLPPPVLKFNDVDFGYDPAKPLFKNMNFGLDLDARIALVGPNGAGKSTLIKLMLGDLEATSGSVERHHHLRIGQFNQHMGDQLDMEVSAIEWLCRHFKEIKPQDMRREVGKFGLTGKSHVVPMKQLSDGQRRRVLFCYLALHCPHMFLMDEPTNALDIETIDALAEAINEYDGGVIFVTHDFRLIDQVAKEIWIVRDGGIEEFDGDIHDYKAELKAKYAQERKEAAEAAAAAAAAASAAAIANAGSDSKAEGGSKKKSKKEKGDKGTKGEEAEEASVKSKKSSKKSKEVVEDDEDEGLAALVKSKKSSKKSPDVVEEEDDGLELLMKSKKSSKKSKSVEEEDLDENEVPVKIKKSSKKSKSVEEEDLDENEVPVKIKKSSRKTKEPAEDDEEEVVKEKKSSKKNKDNAIEDVDDGEIPVKVKKSSKKSKDTAEEEVDDEPMKPKKSSKKSSETLEGADEEPETLLKSRKASKKEKVALEEAGDEMDEDAVVEGLKKKEKKKKSKE
ncbi:P-loop containing nucleoside triphosphate hydrolase protein [Chytriomyces sp. MP71]|nr:P-loop containing nucleoside triphosphate hydrolase protein [Chytriomyces sp. MP71]